jgi:hypothetical protein
LKRAFRNPVRLFSLSPTVFALAKAREHLATAKEMVARMGYGRRNPEVEELEKLLAAE